MAEPFIEDVSDTAFMVARYRAMEGERAHPLFRDPLAGLLSGERGKQIVARVGWQSSVASWSIAVRTCIIDEYVLACVAQGVTLVVNLGAGLDTRPYRMALPESLQWIEVDFPKVIELKESRLSDEQPRCRLERVKLDLTDRPARQRLLAELNGRSENALVLTEGVVPYLSVEEAASLADDLRSQDHVRLWIVDYFSPATRKFSQRRSVKQRMKNAPLRFEPKDWFGFFGEHGWPLREIRYLTHEGARRGRPIPLPMVIKALARLRGLFMSRERRDDLKKFSGYAVLERGEPAAAGGVR